MKLFWVLEAHAYHAYCAYRRPFLYISYKYLVILTQHHPQSIREGKLGIATREANLDHLLKQHSYLGA